MTEVVAAAPDARLRADPLADETVARILAASDMPPRWEAIALVEREMAGWTTNGALAAWQADAATPAALGAALEAFVRQAGSLPDWADPGKIGCAEAVFADTGPMACALLVCASLPEALMARGGIEQDAGQALRGAAGLMFATMAHGGLTEPGGAGLACVLKLRLNQALARHLIVRGNPAEALAYGAAIPALLPDGAGPQRALFARGWDVNAHGLPCNQEALAHTLLGYQYVFLRSLRRLGLGLSKQEKGAWLHAWAVAGHLLGIERDLLAGTMAQAAALFTRLQRDAGPVQPLRGAFDARSMHPMALLMARRLCADATARALGFHGQVSLFARARFAAGMGAARVVDTLMLPLPGWSITRLMMRILGQRIALHCRFEPRDWDLDPQAPGWIKAIEGRFRPGRATSAGRKAVA